MSDRMGSSFSSSIWFPDVAAAGCAVRKMYLPIPGLGCANT